jgi:hypothetical protein
MATKEEILSVFTSKDAAWFAYKEGIQTGYNEAYNSLRNQAAIAAMQGLLANPCRNRPSVSNDYVKLAIDYANALVEQLKKK